MRRVVVTGIGLVSPLGNTVESSWEALLAGKCAVRTISLFDPTLFNCRIAAEVKGFDAAATLDRKSVV